MNKKCMTPKGQKWRLKHLLIAFLVMPILIMTFTFVTFFVKLSNYIDPYSLLLEYKKSHNNPVLGDLGGVAVSVPHHFAKFVTYQDDPQLLHSKVPTQERDINSKLKQFAFEVRYPDMAPDTNDTWQEKHKSTIYNTMWMNVDVVAAESNNFKMQSLVDAIPLKKWDEPHADDAPPETWINKHGYKRLHDPLYGLVVNEVYGYDDAKRYVIPGNGTLDDNIYYHLNESGKIDAYITCSNIKHQAAPCEHIFLLSSASGTQISVHYRIGLLSHWQDIQKKITDLILSFSVSTSNATSNRK